MTRSLKIALSKAKIMQSKERILSELASRPEGEEPVQDYIFSCIKMLQDEVTTHNVEEMFAFILAGFDYHNHFHTFKTADLTRLEALARQWLKQLQGYGSQPVKTYVYSELFHMKSRHQIKAGDITGATFSLAALLRIEDAKIDQGKIFSVVSDILELMLRQRNMKAVHAVFKFLSHQKMSIEKLQDIKVLEIQLLRLSGGLQATLQKIDHCFMHFELDEKHTLQLTWEKLWIQLAMTGRARPLLDAANGRKPSHTSARYVFETFLVAYCHNDPKIKGSVLKFDTLRKKFPREAYKDLEPLYEVMQTLEKAYSHAVDIEVRLENIENMMRDILPKLSVHLRLLTLSALLRFFDRESLHLLAQMCAKTYTEECLQLTSGAAADVIGLVSDLIRKDYQQMIIQDSEPVYIDNLNYSILSRCIKGVKISVKASLTKLEHAIAKIGLDENGKVLLGKREAERIKEILLNECNQLKGPALKLAQIFAAIGLDETDPFQKYLSDLQAKTAFFNPALIREEIKNELGDKSAEILEKWQERPVAAASIGQVHASETPNGDAIAIKVQYPDIRKVISADAKIFKAFVPIGERIFPSSNVKGHLQRGSDVILRECDYRHEAEMQKLFRKMVQENFSDVAYVPRIYDKYSGEKVLTMEFLHAVPLFEYLTNASDLEKDQLAERVYRIIWAAFLKEGIVMGDPHPGNFLLLPDHKIGFIDFGMVEKIKDERRKMWLNIYHDMLMNDPASLRENLESMEVFGPEARDKANYEIAIQNGRKHFYISQVGRRSLFNRQEAYERNVEFTVNAPNREFVKLHIDDGIVARLHLVLNALMSNLGATADWGQIFLDEYNKARRADNSEDIVTADNIAS